MMHLYFMIEAHMLIPIIVDLIGVNVKHNLASSFISVR